MGNVYAPDVQLHDQKYEQQCLYKYQLSPHKNIMYFMNAGCSFSMLYAELGR